jgi:hypothetical protein
MKLEFLRERYDFELDRKDKLTDALALPVGVLTVFAGANVAMAQSFSYKDPWLTGLFLLFLFLAIVAFYVCSYRLWRAYHAQTYIYLPLLEKLEEWEEEDRQFRAYVEDTGGDVSQEQDFDSFMRARIISAADQNTESNDRRSKWMHQSRIWLFVVFSFTSLAAFQYVGDKVRSTMPTGQAQKPSQTTPPTPRPAAEVPQRPQFPENRVIKEGTSGTKQT